MSYDLYLLELAPGTDIDEALESFDETPPSAERVAAFREIVASAAADGYVINEPGTQIFNDSLGATIDVGETSAVVNVAYWHSGSDATKAMQSIVNLVGAIQDATGWVLYDPQSDEIVADHQALIGSSGREMDRITTWADENIRGKKRPWWKFWG